MKAYWLDTGVPVTNEELKRNGVDHRKFNVSNYQDDLDKIKSSQGYIDQDVVAITPAMPNLKELLAKFDKEHYHTLDEVRFVLEGDGIFDIRSLEDEWMRVEVTTGDYISVPANRHHRFYCTESNNIKCVRLFKDGSGWTPIYRERLEPLST